MASLLRQNLASVTKLCWVLINRKHSHSDSFLLAQKVLFIQFCRTLHLSVGHELVLWMKVIHAIFFQTFVRYLFFFFGQRTTCAKSINAKTHWINMKLTTVPAHQLSLHCYRTDVWLAGQILEAAPACGCFHSHRTVISDVTQGCRPNCVSC